MVRFIFVLLSVSCSLYGANPPPAAPQFNWNGSTSSMATGSNWVGGFAPVSGNDVLFFTPSLTINHSPDNDFGIFTLFNTSSSAFSSTASLFLVTPQMPSGAGIPYHLTGNSFQVTAGGSALIKVGGPGSDPVVKPPVPPTPSSIANNIDLNGGTLNILGSGAYDQFSGIISGTGILQLGVPALKEGGGKVQFSGSNSYIGPTNIFNGIIRLGISNSLPTTTALTVQVGGILDLNNYDQTIGVLSGDSSNQGTILTGTGALTVTNSGSNTFIGDILLTGTPPFSGLLGGSFVLGAGSTGILTLNGVGNDYSNPKNIGNTTVKGGTLQAGLLTKTPFGLNSNLTISSPGFLDVSTSPSSATLTFNTLQGNGILNLGSNTITIASGGTTFSGTIHTGSGGLIYEGSNTLTLSGTNSYSGSTIISSTLTGGGGTLSVSSLPNTSSLIFNGPKTTGTVRFGSPFSSIIPITLSNSGTIDINGNNITLSGDISGGGSLTVINSGSAATLTLTGASNTYTGGTNVGSGSTLLLNSSGAFPPPPPAPLTSLSVATGGKFDMNEYSITVSTLSGGGSLVLGTGTITVVGGGAAIPSSTFSGPITGTGGLTFSGGGIIELILSGANSYSGATTINGGGTLTVNNTGLSSATSVIQFSDFGGILQLKNTIPLTRNTSIVLGTNGIFDLQDDAVTLTGPISGTGGLIKQGPGTLTLTPSSASSYTGETEIIGGTLQAGNASAFGDTTLFDVFSNSTLDLNGFNASAGQLIGDPGASVTLGSGVLTLTDGKDIAPFYGVVSGSGGLTLSGGSPSFLGTNTYSGTTTISGGATFNTLNLGSTNSIVYETGGGVLQIGSTSSSSATLVLNDAGTISTNTFDLTISGNISGSGASLTKIGQGTLFLTGTNTFAQQFILEGGTLNVNSSSLGTPPKLVFQQFCGTVQSSGPITQSFPITLTTTGIFDSSGGDITINGAITGLGGLTKTGSGTLTLGGANAYAGLTTILGGTLIGGLPHCPFLFQIFLRLFFLALLHPLREMGFFKHLQAFLRFQPLFSLTLERSIPMGTTLHQEV